MDQGGRWGHRHESGDRGERTWTGVVIGGRMGPGGWEDGVVVFILLSSLFS